MPEIKTYTWVTLREDPEPLKSRYEIRVSTFVEFDDDPSTRGVTGKPTKEQALERALEIAKAERDRTGR